ncbi:MAG: alpha/beta hydrolase-fold protein [Pseudomonadota bacterium]
MSTSVAGTLFALLFLAAAFTSAIHASEDEVRLEVKSTALNDLRNISVILPAGYEDQPNAVYPVLYVLDGSEQLPHTVGTARTLHAYGEMPALIIVGVESTDRTLDMTPLALPGVQNSGGGDRFLDFLVDELKPYIAQRYRTNDYSMLAGHSFGGLLVTYSLIARPDAYQARFAFSPSLRFLGPELTEQFKSAVANTHTNTWLYMNVGAEQQRVLDAFNATRTALAAAPEPLHWKADELPDETHFTTPVIGQFQAFRELFRNWKLTLATSGKGVSAVKDFYGSLSDRLGYEVVPEESAVNTAADEVLQVLGNAPLARELLELSTITWPASSNAYAGLAKVAQVQKDIPAAIQYMEKALSLVDSNDARYVRFTDQLSQLEKAQHE